MSVIMIILLALGYASKTASFTAGGLPQQPAPEEKESAQPTLPPTTGSPVSQGQDYSQPGVPASSIAGKDHRLEVIFKGERIALRNGGRVNFGDGLSMEVFVDPYPPTRLKAWLDLYLTQEPGGQPVTDAEIIMEYDMAFMYHGPFKAIGDNLGDGHYLFELDYIMFGAWDQGVEIRLPDKRYETVLIIIAYP
ncbi:MAG: hypothetical protein ACE5LU_01675 [Anaerolineae bacterium]